MSKKLYYTPIETEAERPTDIRESFIELSRGTLRHKYNLTGETYKDFEDPGMGMVEIHAIDDMYIPKHQIQKISFYYSNKSDIWVVQIVCPDEDQNIHFNIEDHKKAKAFYSEIVKWFVPVPWYKKVGKYMLDAIMFR
jgi:hypothetical protein